MIKLGWLSAGWRWSSWTASQLALGWLEMIESDYILAGCRLAGDDRAGLDLG
jgi:hypothetical protein